VGGAAGVARAGRDLLGKASAAGGGGGSCDTRGTPSMGTDLVSRHGSPRRIPSVPLGRDVRGMIAWWLPHLRRGERDADAVDARRREPARDVVRPGLVGERPEQLEQLLRRRLGGQRDLTDPVKVEPLRQAGEALALTRDAVDLEASPGGPEADGGVFQQAEQRAELRLLVFPRARLAKQGYAACEPRSERFVRRHRVGQSRRNAHPRQRGRLP